MMKKKCILCNERIINKRKNSLYCKECGETFRYAEMQYHSERQRIISNNEK